MFLNIRSGINYKIQTKYMNMFDVVVLYSAFCMWKQCNTKSQQIRNSTVTKNTVGLEIIGMIKIRKYNHSI